MLNLNTYLRTPEIAKLYTVKQESIRIGIYSLWFYQIGLLVHEFLVHETMYNRELYVQLNFCIQPEQKQNVRVLSNCLALLIPLVIHR